MDAALKALAEPHRRKVLTILQTRGELAAGAIAAEFELTRPAVSQHLTVLRGAGLVRERRAGTRRLYSVQPDGLRDVRTFLETFWDDRLVALKERAEQGEE